MKLLTRINSKAWTFFLLPLLILAVQTVSVLSQDDNGSEQPLLTASDERIPDNVGSVAESYSLGGYASKLSVTPGETLDFHISTSFSGPMSLNIYREGEFRQLIHTIENVDAGQYDCAGKYAVGCDWPVVLRFTVPSDWSSGVYTVDIPINSGGKRYIIFWVREAVPGANGRILFLSSVNTYNAYNTYGGKSLYDFNSTNNERSPLVSFDRPFQESGIGQFRRWDGKFVTWAEANNYPLAYATTYDLHYNPSLLTPYDVVVISGHSEYYSWEMRQRMKQYIDGGGRLVNLSGNTMWRQVRYSDDGRTMTGYIPAAIDPVQSQTLTSGPNWDHPIYDSSFSITGTHWPFGGYKPNYAAENGGYWIQEANHWVFEGSGLLENDVIGRTSNPEEMAIHDHEADGMPFNCDPDGSTILGPLGNSGTPHNFTVLGMAPLLYPPKDMYNLNP